MERLIFYRSTLINRRAVESDALENLTQENTTETSTARNTIVVQQEKEKEKAKEIAKEIEIQKEKAFTAIFDSRRLQRVGVNIDELIAPIETIEEPIEKKDFTLLLLIIPAFFFYFILTKKKQ